MGKTTLWEQGIERARRWGFAVLSARAAESETRLSFAGLADLVEGIRPEILGGIPPLQLDAIEVALGRGEARGTLPDPLAISSTLLGAVRLLAACQPVVIALDDVQWLDAPTADILAFVARRGVPGVRFLLSRRIAEPSELERLLLPTGVLRIQLRGLSSGAIARLFVDRLGFVPPRRVFRQLYDASSGNPLFALELGRQLIERGLPEAGAELPFPHLVDDVFGGRVEQLTPPVRRAVLAVALSAGLGRAELAEVVGPGTVTDAERSGVLLVEGARVRASHPLVAAAARHHSTARERQELHLALASAVADPVLRARHLASACPAPDEQLADTVAAAARIAVERAAGHEAEELARQAFRLTPVGSAARPERLLTLAAAQLAAGDLPGAGDVLAAHFAELPCGSVRARGHLLLGEAGDVDVEAREVDLALAEAGDDDAIRAAALTRKATLLASSSVEHLREAEEIARTALAAARRVGPEAERSALAALAWSLVLQGRPLDELAPPGGDGGCGDGGYGAALRRPSGVRHAFRGETAEARRIFTRLLEDAELFGELRSQIGPRIQLCELALRCGDLPEAHRHLDEVAQWTALGEMRIVNARLQAVAAAVRGDPEGTGRWAAIVLEATNPEAYPSWDRLEAERALGVAALFCGDAAGAVPRLRRVWDHSLDHEVGDPGAFPVAGDLVEALLLAGDAAAAHGVLARLRRAAVDQRHPWGLVTTRRCGALLQLREGLLDAGVAGLRAAADAYGDLGLGFAQARTLRTVGRALRRAKKTGSARRAFEESAAVFARLGCAGWAEATLAEAAALAGRSAAGGGLTPSERRVVDLAVNGLSNNEIAGQLFVSVHTVEEHLSRTYAKLGIRSRGQLAGALAPPE